MLGLGSLTLPSAFARVGWVVALVLMALCCAGTLYSGRLFTMLTLKARGLTLHTWPGCRKGFLLNALLPLCASPS